MIYNTRDNQPPPMPVEVLVDGVVIPNVWYTDDEAGIVKTYWVSDDGQPHQPFDAVEFYPDAVADGELMIREILGKVELRPL